MTKTIGSSRVWFQAGFYILFILAPPLNIFRFDLTLGHFIVFGQAWTLGLEPFQQGLISGGQATVNLLLRGFLPLLILGGALIYTAWRWGRLYCGWLCPHFSVVETINKLMLRASGRPTLWESKRLPDVTHTERLYWFVTLVAAISFAFIWALSLLTYLLPPFEIYHNLFTASLTQNQFNFLAVGTLLFTIEFTFARHLFCRFGCAVGVFQSLAWMSNSRAMAVGFDVSHASSCASCNNACDNSCPMRLKPRGLKRRMFSCTECGECIDACTRVQDKVGETTLLRWVEGEEAMRFSAPPVTRPSFTQPTSNKSHH